MEDKPSAVTPERFATGMTFDQYIAYVGTPENLKREGSQGEARRDWSEYLREAYERARLTDAQTAAIRWLAAQPNGPAKVLVISEEWSSDCRRDLPMLARLAEAGGIELRVFRRDGQRFSRSQAPSLTEAPDSNADLDRKSTRLNSSHSQISYAVFCLKKKKKTTDGVSMSVKNLLIEDATTNSNLIRPDTSIHATYEELPTLFAPSVTLLRPWHVYTNT